MKWIGIALIYIAFFGLIGLAVWYLKSGWPLWALILTPSFSTKSEDNG